MSMEANFPAVLRFGRSISAPEVDFVNPVRIRDAEGILFRIESVRNFLLELSVQLADLDVRKWMQKNPKHPILAKFRAEEGALVRFVFMSQEDDEGCYQTLKHADSKFKGGSPLHKFYRWHGAGRVPVIRTAESIPFIES